MACDMGGAISEMTTKIHDYENLQHQLRTTCYNMNLEQYATTCTKNNMLQHELKTNLYYFLFATLFPYGLLPSWLVTWMVPFLNMDKINIKNINSKHF